MLQYTNNEHFQYVYVAVCVVVSDSNVNTIIPIPGAETKTSPAAMNNTKHITKVIQ